MCHHDQTRGVRGLAHFVLLLERYGARFRDPKAGRWRLDVKVRRQTLTVPPAAGAAAFCALLVACGGPDTSGLAAAGDCDEVCPESGAAGPGRAPAAAEAPAGEGASPPEPGPPEALPRMVPNAAAPDARLEDPPRPAVRPVTRPADDVVRFERGGVAAHLDGQLLGDGAFEGGVFTGDGVDHRIAIPSAGAPAPDAVGELDAGTISVWVRYTSVSNGDAVPDTLPVLYYGRNTQSFDDGFDGLTIYIGHGYLADPQQRQIYFTIYEGHDVLLCFDSAAISLEPNVWYHYAVTIGPDGHHGYLNGQEFQRRYNSLSDSVQAFFSTVRDRDRMLVGRGMFGVTQRWWNFNGSIADLRIYDRVLSAKEIANLAAAGP